MRFFVLGRQPFVPMFVPWFLARAALTKVRAHGSRENRSSLQSAIIYIYIMISICIIWILYGLWLINIHKPLLLSTSHPQDTPARPRSWVWASRFVAPAKAQYLGGGDPWPWDIGGVYHGKSPSDTRRLRDIFQKKHVDVIWWTGKCMEMSCKYGILIIINHVGMGANMGVDRWKRGMSILYNIQ